MMTTGNAVLGKERGWMEMPKEHQHLQKRQNHSTALEAGLGVEQCPLFEGEFIPKSHS